LLFIRTIPFSELAKIIKRIREPIDIRIYKIDRKIGEDSIPDIIFIKEPCIEFMIIVLKELISRL